MPFKFNPFSGTFDLVNRLIENLSDLNDVDTTGVSDGDILVYNNANSQFEPQANTGGGAIPAATQVIASAEFDPTLAATKVLSAGGDTTSYYTMRTPDNTQYQVPGAGTLTLYACVLYCNSSNMSLRFGYADTATNNAAPTNPVYRNPSASGSFAGYTVTTSTTEDNFAVFAFECPANKFPFVQGSGGQWVATFYGIES